MSLTVTEHAAIRYRERVKPTLDYDVARAELQALCDVATKVDVPDWAFVDPDDTELDFCIELSDGIVALVSAKDTVLTVVVRGSHHPSARAALTRAKKKKRRERRKRTANYRGKREEPKKLWR